MKLSLPPLGRRAFTLLELLVVVVVIGILAGLTLVRFGKVQERAYTATMQSDLRNFATARAIYVSDADQAPGSVASVTGYAFSEHVFETLYNSLSAIEWSLMVGHAKTATRCHLSTLETGGAHRISCSLSNTQDFVATTESDGQTVTLDATDAIQELAFGGESSWFAAMAARDEDIAMVIWEMGDGTRLAGPVTTHKRITYTYAKVGVYEVTLTLIKKDGTMRSGRKKVTIKSITPDPLANGNRAPTAVLYVYSSWGHNNQLGTPKTDLPFWIEGYYSTDPDGTLVDGWKNSDIVHFAFTLSNGMSWGGSNWDTDSWKELTLPTGSYSVTLTVRDQAGATSTLTQNFQVTVNEAPLLTSVGTLPSSAHWTEYLTVSCDGSDSDGYVTYCVHRIRRLDTGATREITSMPGVTSNGQQLLGSGNYAGIDVTTYMRDNNGVLSAPVTQTVLGLPD